MSDIKFISGLSFKAKNPKAPDYVICKGSIRREDLIAWLQSEYDEWVNFDVKVSQNGKWYAAVDDWKPGQERPARKSANKVAPPAEPFEGAFQDSDLDDLPF